MNSYEIGDRLVFEPHILNGPQDIQFIEDCHKHSGQIAIIKDIDGPFLCIEFPDGSESLYGYWHFKKAVK